VREIESAENVSANVEGDIEEVDGVLRITQIRLHYRIVAPAGSDEKIGRALSTYADKCPAYQSVKECIKCTWDAEIVTA
jgi:uncharacterized OsmC-like protein